MLTSALFLEAATTLGSFRTKNDNWSPTFRDEVVYQAKRALYKDYVFIHLYKYDFWSVMISGIPYADSVPIAFRCDGLVEWSIEQAIYKIYDSSGPHFYDGYYAVNTNLHNPLQIGMSAIGFNAPGSPYGISDVGVVPPSNITVPSSDNDGSYTVSWGTSSTSSVTYVLEEARNSSFTSYRRTAYSGTSRSTTINGRSSGVRYYYRVKAIRSGYTDSDWRTGSNSCLVTITPTAGTPSSITVPSSDNDGSYTVNWGSSSTSSVTYVLEEARNSSFTSYRRTAYSGTSRSTTITGRSNGVRYYYRVKATRSGYDDSTWRTGSNSCLVTITPKPTVTITATDSSAAEPANNGYFTVSRTGSTSSSLRVYYGTSGSTATSGSDYAALPGSVNIPSGQSSALISVIVIDDSQAESSETVKVTLSSNSAYTVGNPSNATVTIADNDAAKLTVTITATDSQTSEVTSGSPIDYANFRVSRTGSTSSQLVVYFSKSGSAVWPSDYVWNGGPDDIMVIQPGSSYADYSVRAVDDTLQEGNETITWTLVSHSAYTIGSPSNATITIIDNDAAKPTVTITATDSTGSEPGTNAGKYRISRTGSTASSLSVYFTMSGTATNGTDYNTISSPKTISAGSSYVDVTLTPKDDSAVEGNETAVLTISTNSTYERGSPYSATVTILEIVEDYPEGNYYKYETSFNGTFSGGPSSLAVDLGDNHLYFRNNDKVYQYDNTGSLLSSFLCPSDEGLAVDYYDAVYVPFYNTSTETATVNVYSKSGDTWSKIRSWNLDLPYNPTDNYGQSLAIAVNNSSATRVYVLCSDEFEGSVVQEFDRTGNLQGSWSPNNMDTPPCDMTYEYNNNLFYLLSYNWARVYKYSSSGSLIKSWGNSTGGSSEEGKFNHPTGISVSPAVSSLVSVADSGNKRVQIFTSSGTLLDIVNGGNMDFPKAVCMSSGGERMFLWDSGNKTLRSYVWQTIEIVPELSVTPDSRAVNANVGTSTFTVDNTGSGTMSWTASVISGENWLSITSDSTSGTNSGTITAEFSANTSNSSRTGTIRATASGAGGSPKDVTVIQSSPGTFDTDNDSLPDDWENQHFGNLATADNTTDTDGDGLLDKDEYTYKTNPNNTDSDGDGDSDGDEVMYGSDPTLIADTLESHRPDTPVILQVSGDVPLCGQIFDVDGFGDPDLGNYLSDYRGY